MSLVPRDDTTKDAAQFLLCMEKNKSVIKEADMKKKLDLDKQGFQAVLVDSSLKLEDSLGCVVTSNDGRIMLCNNLPSLKAVQSSDDVEEDAKNGLLLVILTTIFMSTNPATPKPVPEAVITKALKEFGINVDGNDAVFGDISKLISPSNTSEFVQKGWINHEKSRTHETTEYFYSWGPRSISSINPVELLESFCKIIDDPNPKLWKGHYSKAQAMHKDMKKFRADNIGREGARRL